MHSVWPRRSFLTALAASGAGLAADKNPVSPSELRRLRDPATEFELVRLTDPRKCQAFLPPAPLRAVSRNNNSLLYCSDRSGSVQVWRMDLKNGESHMLSSGGPVLPDSVTFLPDDRFWAYADPERVNVIRGNKLKTVYRAEGQWRIAGQLAIGDDGSLASMTEEREGRYRLRVFATGRGGTGRTADAHTLFEADKPVLFSRIRPKRSAVLYNAGDSLMLVNPDGREGRKLNTPADRSVGWALWSADGKAVHYLAAPRERGSIQLREHFPDTGEDKLLGATTQFVRFARNADSSVFAGVSGSKASPYILLFLRAAHRELTLAEHKVSDIRRASITFSPNSQKLFYTTDREGKSAIYSIALERLVSDTEDSDESGFK